MASEMSNKSKGVEEFKSFYLLNRNSEAFGKRRFIGRFAGESSWTYDCDCVLGVFTEKHYKGESSDAGHPWDNVSEFFASVTAVMRAYSDELFNKIEMLPTQKEKDLAKESMFKVLDLYQKHCKTGTELFPKKVLRYLK